MVWCNQQGHFIITIINLTITIYEPVSVRDNNLVQADVKNNNVPPAINNNVLNPLLDNRIKWLIIKVAEIIDANLIIMN